MGIGEVARQVIEEWESFSWEQKQKVVEYVKLQGGEDSNSGGDVREVCEELGLENCEGEEIVRCSQDEETEPPKRESGSGGRKFQRFKRRFKQRNQFNFEDLSEDLVQKSPAQVISEKSHFNMSVGEICRRVEYKDRIKKLKRQDYQASGCKMSPYLVFVKQHTPIVKA